MIRSIEPQESPADLAPNPHSITLRGRPAEASFPPRCPRCGKVASKSIGFSKVFLRSDGDSSNYVIETVEVPFCDACIALHRRQEPRPSWFEQLRTGLGSMHIVGAIFPALAGLFLLHLAFGDLAHGPARRGGVELVIAAACAAIAWLQVRAVWQQTAHLRVLPQTEVTRAFDFSDDSSALFEGRRFVCTMRDEGFAQAFRLLNVQKEWKAQSPEAIAERRRSNWKTWALAAAIGVLLLLN